MKKQLLYGLALLLSTNLSAQATNEAASHPRNTEAESGDVQIIHETSSQATFEKDINTETIYIGAASNIYSTLDVSQNQVHYNPELDIVTFVHRQNTATWSDGGSGVVRYDISTDGGATWTLDELLTPMLRDSNNTGGTDDGIHIETPDGTDIVYGYRYPSGLVMTPSGGSIDDSYYVAMGPCVSSPLGSPWAHNYFASHKLDGSDANDEQIFQVLNNADSGWANIDYMGRGLVRGGEDVYAISTNWNNDIVYNLSQYVFWKGSINDSDDDLEWEYTIVHPDFKLSSGSPIVNGNVGVAFNLDGSVGYMVIGGCLSDYTGDMERPVVYKTTDNGATWVLQAELDIAASSVGVALGGLPYFRDFDVVVDANDDLHVLGEMMQYDETLTNFSYEGHFADFILSSSENTWTDIIVGDILNSDAGGYLPGSFQDLYTHVQISVSEDGEKVFYGWSESVDNEINDTPDIMARGMDVNNATWTDIKNLTLDTDAESVAAYATLSPVSISDGDDFDYELPWVCVPDYTGELDETFFAYIKGVGFNESEFGPMSVTSIDKDLASFNIFPNPSQDNTVLSFNLLNNVDVTISIFNSVGQRVAMLDDRNRIAGPHRFDVNTSNFNEGLYFVELIVDGNSVSKKLLIAR